MAQEDTSDSKNTYKVGEEILNKSTECSNGFACLSNPRDRLCKVEYVIEDRLFFVIKKKREHCRYFLPYGAYGCCGCPVRKELYKRYRV